MHWGGNGSFTLSDNGHLECARGHFTSRARRWIHTLRRDFTTSIIIFKKRHRQAMHYMPLWEKQQPLQYFVLYLEGFHGLTKMEGMSVLEGSFNGFWPFWWYLDGESGSTVEFEIWAGNKNIIFCPVFDQFEKDFMVKVKNFSVYLQLESILSRFLSF